MVDPLVLPARRVTVIAPHPDDESLGCGGLIAAFCSDGRAVQTLFITDGAGSHPNSPTWTTARLAAQRRVEAEAALACLGAGDQPRGRLDLPDAAAPMHDAAAIAALGDLLSGFAPELVLVPWRRDPHCDHRAAWSLTRAALAARRLEPDVLEYAIWLDELGGSDDHPRMDEVETLVFDIAAFRERKRQAVAAHLSQTTDLIDDDAGGFRLTDETIGRLVGDTERYWRVRT